MLKGAADSSDIAVPTSAYHDHFVRIISLSTLDPCSPHLAVVHHRGDCQRACVQEAAGGLQEVEDGADVGSEVHRHDQHHRLQGQDCEGDGERDMGLAVEQQACKWVAEVR